MQAVRALSWDRAPRRRSGAERTGLP